MRLPPPSCIHITPNFPHWGGDITQLLPLTEHLWGPQASPLTRPCNWRVNVCFVVIRLWTNTDISTTPYFPTTPPSSMPLLCLETAPVASPVQERNPHGHCVPMAGIGQLPRGAPGATHHLLAPGVTRCCSMLCITCWRWAHGGQAGCPLHGLTLWSPLLLTL